jgi:sugar phosphate isomerase/epimerase
MPTSHLTPLKRGKSIRVSKSSITSVLKRSGKMKLSFSTLGCPDWDLKKIVDMAGEYGFDGVELRVMGKQHIDPALNSGERKAVKNLFQQKNVEICCLAGYSFFNSDDTGKLESNKNLLHQYIDLAYDLEVPYIRTFVGDYSTPMLEDQVIENTSHYLNICGKIAEEKGVQILIETHDSFSTAQKVNKILKKIDNNGVAALWDIHHPYNNGEMPETTYDILGNRIKHVHIKDVAGETLCLMGKGSLPVRQIVDLLKSENYNGYLSLEWEKMWVKELEDPEIAFPQYIKYMRSII